MAKITANNIQAGSITLTTLATSVSNSITSASVTSQAAFDKANTVSPLDSYARQTANAAFNKANTAITTSGGSITGSLNVSQNLTVTGNLSVLGTTTSINTEQYEIVDPVIKLGIGNYITDQIDIGFAGHYNDGANAHTGLIRDFATKDYYLFQGYTPELAGNNNVDINHTSFSTANLVASLKGNVIATTVTIGGRNQASVDSTQNTNITHADNKAQAAFSSANTNATNLTNFIELFTGVEVTQNTRISNAEGVDLAQNTRMTIIEGVDTTQNTRITISEGVDVGQNTRMTIIEGVDTTQNTNITIADSKAQAAFDKANAANSLAQAAYNQANTGGGGGGGTLDQFARDTANGANGLAAGAFGKANTSITTSGGTITGSLNVSQNLTVTGNLSVLGTTVTINTSSFTVSDSLITLGTGNYTSDLLDIGISGHYNDGTNAHTGFIRDPGTKEWYVFKGYTPEVNANNNIDINHASFAKANVNADYFKGNVIASTVSGNVIALNTSALSNTMIGYLGVPQRVVVMGGSDSLVLADAGKQLYLRPDSNVYSIFIPSNASVPFPVGTAIVTILTGPYSANVAPLAGVTLRMAGNTSGANIARTLGSYSMASLLKVENDVWFISGAGVT